MRHDNLLVGGGEQGCHEPTLVQAQGQTSVWHAGQGQQQRRHCDLTKRMRPCRSSCSMMSSASCPPIWWATWQHLAAWRLSKVRCTAHGQVLQACAARGWWATHWQLRHEDGVGLCGLHGEAMLEKDGEAGANLPRGERLEQVAEAPQVAGLLQQRVQDLWAMPRQHQ